MELNRAAMSGSEKRSDRADGMLPDWIAAASSLLSPSLSASACVIAGSIVPPPRDCLLTRPVERSCRRILLPDHDSSDSISSKKESSYDCRTPVDSWERWHCRLA